MSTTRNKWSYRVVRRIRLITAIQSVLSQLRLLWIQRAPVVPAATVAFKVSITNAVQKQRLFS